MSTLTDQKDMKCLFEYLDKNGIDYSVDNNPSPEKVSRIQKAIERKNDIIDASIKIFKNSIGLNA